MHTTPHLHTRDQYSTCKPLLHQQDWNLSWDCDRGWTHDHIQDCDQIQNCDHKLNGVLCIVTPLVTWDAWSSRVWCLQRKRPGCTKSERKCCQLTLTGYGPVLSAHTKCLIDCNTEMLISMWYVRLHDDMSHDFAWHSTAYFLAGWVTHRSCKHGSCTLHIWQKVDVSRGANNLWMRLVC